MTKPRRQTKKPGTKYVADNAAAEVRGSNLLITVGLEVELCPSSTGRTMIIGNTHGFQAVPGMPGYWYMVLVTKKRPGRKGAEDGDGVSPAA